MPKKEAASQQLVPAEIIEKRILLIHGHKVILDTDLAVLYQVSTSALNQAVRRNLDRFPEDFKFPEQSGARKLEITNCDIQSRRKDGSSQEPLCFYRTGRCDAIQCSQEQTRDRGEHRHHAHVRACSVRSSRRTRSLPNGSPRSRRTTTSGLR